MSTVARVPVEDYLHMTEKPNREYRSGVLYPKAMPTKLHAIIQRVLMTLLQDPSLNRSGAQPFPELTLRISPATYLIPDVAVVDRFPGPYPEKGVRLCCEILSPEDRLGTMLAKCEEYHAWGVPFCWVIDPVKRVAWEYHSGAEPGHVGERLHGGEIAIGIEELFSEFDR